MATFSQGYFTGEEGQRKGELASLIRVESTQTLVKTIGEICCQSSEENLLAETSTPQLMPLLFQLLDSP
jgi:hypothetical protein